MDDALVMAPPTPPTPADTGSQRRAERGTAPGRGAGDALDLVDEGDLRAAYRLHGGAILALALTALGDRGLAEEVTQDVFVRAWRHRRRFDPARGSLRTWLFAIARNRIVDAARRRGARPPAAGGAPPVDQGHDPIAALDDRVAVHRALDRLPEDQRTALIEVHLRGRTSADVAAELGVAPATVRSRIHHGLKALRTAANHRELR